jgi:peptidoglycan/xylan/chitin deacetylase (PgdA/CDA1 family)
LWDFLFEVRFPPLRLDTENVFIDGEPWERQTALEDRHFWFPATWEELRTAAQKGELEIGSHMVSHVPLSWLSEDEQRFQLQHSRDELSRIIGSPVTACSYPHGFVDERVIKIAQEVYSWSFTNIPGRVSIKTSRGTAPRYHVPGEAPEQVRRVVRWSRNTSLLRRIDFSSRGVW